MSTLNQTLPNYIFDSSKYFVNKPTINDANQREYSIIAEHLKALRCSNPDKVSKCMTHDMKFQSPISQDIMNLYCRSKYTSFHEFQKNSSLCNLPQQNIELHTLLQQSQYYFEQDICTPLTSYLSSKQSFKGDSKQIYNQTLKILNYSKNRANAMPDNCCQHIDAFFNLETSEGNDRSEMEHRANNDPSNVDETEEMEDSDDDDDEQYGAQLDEYTRNASSEQNSAPLQNDMNEAQSQKSFKKYPLQEMDAAMRNLKTITKFDKFEPFSYVRQEIIPGEDSISTFDGKETIPALSPKSTPLFRHYRTINAMKEMTKTMANILCISYHVLIGCVQVFCYISIGGKIYGQRVFSQDLETIFSSLFPNSEIETPTTDITTMEHNYDTGTGTNHTDVIFDNDPDYQEIYKLVLCQSSVKSKSIESQQNTTDDQHQKLIEIKQNAEIINEQSKSGELEYKSPYSTMPDIKIGITRQLIHKLKNMIMEQFCNENILYHFIDISTSLQIKDKQLRIIPCGQQNVLIIINYDLHSKNAKTEFLYGIVVKDCDCTWTLREFMTKHQIAKKYKVTSNKLPKSCRQSPAFTKLMMKLLMTESIIEVTNWCNMKHNIGFLTDVPPQIKTFKICHQRMIENCNKSFQDPDLPQFRIVCQDDDNYWIDWIKVIRVQYLPLFTFYAAIQYGYDQKQRTMILKSLNEGSPEDLPYDIQVMVIQYCIPIQIKAIHHDPTYIFSLNKAVGDEQSQLSFDKLSCLSPWPKHFEIGDFKSEFHTLVEVLNARPNGRNIDISAINEQVTEQELEFNYSYFLCNDIGEFRRTFPTVSHGKAKKIYNRLRGEREIENMDEQIDCEMNVTQQIQFHEMLSLHGIYNWEKSD